MNNGETYGVKLTAFIKPFIDKIKEATQISKQASDTIKKDLLIQPDFDVTKAKKRLEELNVFIKETQEWLNNMTKSQRLDNIIHVEQLAQAQQEYNELSNKIKQCESASERTARNTKEIADNSKKMNTAWGKIEGSMKRNLKSIRSMTLSLIGIRSIYAVISRASSAYLSQDTEQNEKMQASWVALGAVMAPLIEYLSNLMLTFAKAVNYVALQLTGVDYIARALNKSLGTTKKQLSSIDEITNLGENTPIENLQKFLDSVDIDTNGLDKVVNLIRPLYNLLKDIASFVSEHPNILAGLFVGFAVAPIINSIATILGLPGGTTGLYGIAGVLAIIAGINIWNIVDGIKDLNNALKGQNEQSENSLEQTKTIADYIKKNRENMSPEEVARYTTQIESLLNISNSQIGTLQSRKEWWNFWQWDDFNRQIENEQEEIDILTEALKTLNGETYQAKVTVEVEYDTKSYLSKNWQNLVKGGVKLGKVFDVSQWPSIFGDWLGKKIMGYDVGTNYVPNDQLAMIHEGEMIVPKAYNPNAGYTGDNSEVNELLYEIAGLLSSRQSATFEIDGKEFVRATYNEYENERVRLNGNTSLKRS